jgi:protein-export membrane protein SecD
MTKLQLKWLGVVALVAVSIFSLYPSVGWYTLPAAERDQLEKLGQRPPKLINLGLDLKGGTHLVMELDVAKLPAGADAVDAMDRAIEIIRNRVDAFGVAEPLIARQGQRWIVVQLPGITDSARAKDLIGKTARLEFRMVEQNEKANTALSKIAGLGQVYVGEPPMLSTGAAKLVPEGMELARTRDGMVMLLNKDIPLTGAQLETARLQKDSDYNLPVVAFKFRPEASTLFANLTSANTGRQMAIVLDGVVQSAPVIKGRISGGSGIIEGQFTDEDAKNLAIVLRAGALPAPINIIEERTVGPSLGEDSIRAGTTAAGVGIILIFAFFIIYYRMSGLFACLTIAVNLLILFAMMAYLGATLTLPGLAGISLNVATAVDANVLILERIREELAKGKPFRLAVEAGYDLSMSAILDSNVTLLIASVLLFQFGTGPIKGFAVTLTTGNLISMFTATVLSRMIYDAWLSNREVEAVSI